MITVEGDEAVLSRIMHIVTLAVRDFVDLEYIEVMQNIQSVSLADFSGFLRKVVTRQKLKLTHGLSFPLVVVALCFAPAATRQRKITVRLLTGDLFDWTRLGRPLYTSVSRAQRHRA